MDNEAWISNENNENRFRQCFSYSLLLICLVTIFISLSCHDISSNKEQNPPQRISSNLSKELNKLENPSEVNDTQFVPRARVDGDGRVQIYVKLNHINQENIAQLKEHGLKVDIYDERQNIVQGWALPDNIRIISQFDFVKLIDLPNYGYTN